MLPIDKDGYVKSFTYDQREEIIDFLNEYGVVVVRDILSNDRINETINSIWNHDELTSRGVKRDDVGTWERCWPRNGQIERKGWICTYDDMKCITSWKNRFEPKLVDVFENLWHDSGGKRDLRVKLDRYGVMRPLINKSWRTDDGWLHTDQNPVTEKDVVKFQGILTISDSTENTGGFLCIPGFHKEWKEYCASGRPDEDVCPFLTSSDGRAEKVTAKAGSLIVWDSRLPHCNYPNDSEDKFRMVQYITYHPVEFESDKRRRFRKEDALWIDKYLRDNGYKLGEKQLRFIGYY